MVFSILQITKPDKILDIGCGAGKYGFMSKSAIPSAKRIGIEVERKYVEKFKLNEIYDEVRIGDAWEILKNTVNESYDLVIIGDSIEHMPKSVGIDLLNFLTYRSKFILVLTPEFITQHEMDGVVEEAHISVWSEHDFTWHDTWAWDNSWMMSLFLLSGYAKPKIPFRELVNIINNAKIPIFEQFRQRIVRHANLNLVTRERHDENESGEKVMFRPL